MTNRRKLTLEEISNLDGTREFRFSPPSGVSYPKERTQLIIEHYKEKEHDSKRINELRIAASELICNAIWHGNEIDYSKNVTVYSGWNEDDFYFAVKDEGKGFDIDNPPTINGGNGVDGGAGIPYSRKSLDLLYNFGDNIVYGCKSDSKREASKPKKRLLTSLFK